MRGSGWRELPAGRFSVGETEGEGRESSPFAGQEGVANTNSNHWTLELGASPNTGEVAAQRTRTREASIPVPSPNCFEQLKNLWATSVD